MGLLDFQVKTFYILYRPINDWETNLDDDEFVELHKVPLSQIDLLLKDNKIEDAKTIIALQHLLLNYNHSK